MATVAIRAAAALIIAVAAAPRNAVACDPAGADAAPVAAARAAIATACPCAEATSHGDYVQCATRAANGVGLTRSCLREVVRCAGRSTCGRPGTAVCCRTDADGSTRGRIVARPSACVAPRGGSACVAAAASVCEGCVAGGCVTTTTTTTTLPGVCGNGIIEPGDPTIVGSGEQCDGQPICGTDCLVHAGFSCDLGGGYCFGNVPGLGFDTYWTLAKPCYIIGGTSRPGRCTPGDPSACAPPPPGVQLPPFVVCGTIVDGPLPTTTLCCGHADGSCAQATVTRDSEAQGFPCNLAPFGTDLLVVGTCGADGRCVPAS